MGNTSVGFNSPFKTGCHCFAISGNIVFKSRSPFGAPLPLQMGQPVSPDVLLLILACHSWPSLQSHQALLLLWGNTISGVVFPFSEGCHSVAILGKHTAKFQLGDRCFPRQDGHSVPCTRLENLANHSCPNLHFHQTLRLLPLVISRNSSGILTTLSISNGSKAGIVLQYCSEYSQHLLYSLYDRKQ